MIQHPNLKDGGWRRTEGIQLELFLRCAEIGFSNFLAEEFPEKTIEQFR